MTEIINLLCDKLGIAAEFAEEKEREILRVTQGFPYLAERVGVLNGAEIRNAMLWKNSADGLPEEDEEVAVKIDGVRHILPAFLAPADVCGNDEPKRMWWLPGTEIALCGEEEALRWAYIPDITAFGKEELPDGRERIHCRDHLGDLRLRG